MDTPTAGTIESAVMVKAYEPGVEARKAIMAEIRRREDAGEDPPTYRELGARIGRSYTTAREHVKTLVEVGLLQQSGEGRNRKVALTASGRICTD